MSLKVKGVIFFILFIALFLVIMVISEHARTRQEDKDQHTRMDSTGKIQFKGKVINSKIYSYGGKDYYMVCIRLDYSSVGDFYIFNALSCLKIKNNTATMAAGTVNSYFGVPVYIEANMNQSGKVIYHYKNGDTDEFAFTLDPGGMAESDLSFCDQ